MRLTFTTIMVTFFFMACAQGSRDKKDFTVSFTADYTTFPGYISTYGGGINMEYMVTKHVGFQTAAAGAKDYAYFNGVALLAPLIIVAGEKGSAKDTITLLELLIWISLIENPAFHIILGRRFEIIPYLSLFRARYIWNDEQGRKGWYASRSTGLKASYFIKDNLFINGYVEGSRLYAHGQPEGWLAGFSIGFVIDDE